MLKRTSSYRPTSDTTAIIRLYRLASLKNQVYSEAADIYFNTQNIGVSHGNHTSG